MPVDEPIQGKRVSAVELFFDLVFIFAITEVTALVRADHTAMAVLRGAVVFVPVYWLWVGTTVHANTRDIENTVDRVGILGLGLGGLIMALALPEAYGDGGVVFAAAYIGARVLLALLFYRGRPFFMGPMVVAAVVSGPLLLVGSLLPPPWRLSIWSVAALLDLAAPAVFRPTLSQLRFDQTHLPERFGLFLIIALGESIVSIGLGPANAHTLDAPTILTVGLAFALVAGLWWIYFVSVAEALRHAFDEVQRAAWTDLIRRVLSYAHLCLVGGVLAAAVGLAAALSDPFASQPRGAALLHGGCALYLATFGYTRWQIARQWSVLPVSAAAVTVVLLPLGWFLPAVADVALLAGVLATLDVLKTRKLARQ